MKIVLIDDDGNVHDLACNIVRFEENRLGRDTYDLVDSEENHVEGEELMSDARKIFTQIVNKKTGYKAK